MEKEREDSVHSLLEQLKCSVKLSSVFKSCYNPSPTMVLDPGRSSWSPHLGPWKVHWIPQQHQQALILREEELCVIRVLAGARRLS